MRGDDNVLPASPIRQHSAKRREHEHRNLAGESDRTEQECRACHAVDEPRLRDALHPRSNERDELAAEEKLEIAVPERAKHRGRLDNRPISITA